VGGAWANDTENARVAARNNNHPDNNWNNNGFRVWGAAHDSLQFLLPVVQSIHGWLSRPFERQLG
jgi:hypothetical protein